MADTQRTVSRRDLLRASAAAATFTLIPRHVLGGPGVPSANERLNIAAVGVGGMGAKNLSACAGENIVALCDVDADGYAAKTIAKYPGAKTYKDFRVMFDQQKDIDAVNAWQDITANRLYLAGSSGADECFKDDHCLPAEASDGPAEGCVTAKSKGQ